MNDRKDATTLTYTIQTHLAKPSQVRNTKSHNTITQNQNQLDTMIEGKSKHDQGLRLITRCENTKMKRTGNYLIPLSTREKDINQIPRMKTKKSYCVKQLYI